MLSFVYDDASGVRTEMPLTFLNASAEFVRVDDVFVDLEERHVAIKRLMQQDYELTRLVLACCQNGSLPRPSRLVMSVAIP